MIDAPMAVALALLIFVALAISLVVGWRHGRLAWAFAGVSVVMAIFWLLAIAATASGFREADVTFDCGVHCNFVQRYVGISLGLGSLAYVILVVLALSLAGVSRFRDRKSDRELSG